MAEKVFGYTYMQSDMDMSLALCMEPLDTALESGRVPDVFNTDQGSQYSSREWQERMCANGIIISQGVQAEAAPHAPMGAAGYRGDRPGLLCAGARGGLPRAGGITVLLRHRAQDRRCKQLRWANRPVLFSKEGEDLTVACTYDYMGRRATKKVTENGTVTLHQRYLYRGYLQIAACDLLRPAHPCIWLITWDPTQDVATRPLAIQKDGTWYTYGWDLTKNICEVYGQQGYIRTACTYSPYGQVASSGDVEQPIQWSSEFNDTELALIYYNYRHYNPVDGRWVGRDFDQERKDLNDYLFAKNSPSYFTDVKGLWVIPVIIFIAGAVVGAYAGIFIENECHVVGEIAEKEVRQKCTRTCKYPSMWACCKNTEKSRVRKAKYICELTLTGKKLKFYKWLDNKKPNPAECAGKNCIDKGVKCSIS